MTLPTGFLDELRGRVRLSEIVGRKVAWDRRKTNAGRGDFWGCCPFHHEKTPSFHVDDRKGFYHCFGCHASGDAIRFIRETENVGFIEAVRTLAAEAGMEMPDGREGQRYQPAPDAGRLAGREDDEARRAAERGLDRARRIWDEAGADDGLLMAYLRVRGVAVGALERAWGGPPPTLRLHPSLPFYEGEDRRGRPLVIHRGPAMVGLMARGGELVGVHMTWITAEGRAFLGRRKLPRKMRGLTGAMAGVPVVLASERATGRMVVGEGIETVLAWWSHAHLRFLAGDGPKWSAEAALTRGALAGDAHPRFRERDPATGGWLPSAIPDMDRPKWLAPDWVDHLVILGEGSAENPAAAERESWRAHRRHALRTDGMPRRCELRTPPGGWGSGKDFADVAAGQAA